MAATLKPCHQQQHKRADAGTEQLNRSIKKKVWPIRCAHLTVFFVYTFRRTWIPRTSSIPGIQFARARSCLQGGICTRQLSRTPMLAGWELHDTALAQHTPHNGKHMT